LKTIKAFCNGLECDPRNCSLEIILSKEDGDIYWRCVDDKTEVVWAEDPCFIDLEKTSLMGLKYLWEGHGPPKVL